MWKKYFILTVIVACASSYFFNVINRVTKKPSPVIEISTGKLQGVISYSRSGKEMYEYLGIPYAKPPLNDLRFEPPQPATKWEGILDASVMPQKCVQIDIISQIQQGQEDCLKINIFRKVEDTKKLLPVMVWIHGGIFMYGGSDMFGGRYFVDEDVILVTIGYRVASLGFLNTGDETVRGNMGLKDQVLALIFVQNEIIKFGGDKDRVTIFGESAGGCSTHLHMMSPMSKGLFHRAISQSGTAISPFVISRSPAEQAKRLGKQMNCPTHDSKAMVSCLKKIDAVQLIEGAHRETCDLLHESIAVFSPTIETIRDSNAFLTEDPMDILKQGKIVNKVPWISGVNSGEGLILSAVVVTNETILEAMDKNWNDVAPKFMFYERNDTISKMVRKYYFGNSKKIGTPKNLNTITNMLSDRAFYWPASESALLQSKVSPVYLYYYSHVGEFSLAHFITLFRGRFHYVVEILMDMFMAAVDKHILGRRHHHYDLCTHADEQFIQFNTGFTPEVLPQNGEHYKMSVDFVKLFADFCKDKKDLNFRGVKWLPVDPKKSPLRYLMIDMSYGIIDEPFSTRIKLWRDNPVV